MFALRLLSVFQFVLQIDHNVGLVDNFRILSRLLPQCLSVYILVFRFPYKDVQ